MTDKVYHRITADSQHPTYRGRVELGTYSQEEADKGCVSLRVDQIKNQGYQNIEVNEIHKDA